MGKRALLGVVSIASDQKALEALFEAVERESERVLGGDLVGTELDFY